MGYDQSGAWTGTYFYPGDPSVDDTAAVRFLIGDTDEREKLLSNEEIAYALTQEADVYAASAFCARAIAAYFTRESSKSVSAPGGQSISIQFATRSAQYTKLAETLAAKSTAVAVPFAGGISQDDKDTLDEDSDRVQPGFYRGQFDYS